MICMRLASSLISMYYCVYCAAEKRIRTWGLKWQACRLGRCWGDSCSRWVRPYRWDRWGRGGGGAGSSWRGGILRPLQGFPLKRFLSWKWTAQLPWSRKHDASSRVWSGIDIHAGFVMFTRLGGSERWTVGLKALLPLLEYVPGIKGSLGNQWFGLL